jgi:exopolysaccharide biosynthesis polyprenyl glycosylphosphotransferase
MQIEHQNQPSLLTNSARIIKWLAGWLPNNLALHLSERKVLLGVVDLVLLVGVLLVRLILTLRIKPEWGDVAQHWHWLAIFAIIWLPIATAVGCYDLRVAAAPFPSTFRIVQAYLLASGLYLLIPHISAPLFDARIAWFGQVVCSLVLVGGWRLSYSRLVAQPIFRRRVLIVGAGAAGQTLAATVREHARSDFEIVGFVDDDPAKLGSVLAGCRVLGDSTELPSIASQAQASDVVLAITHEMRPTLFSALLACQEQGHPVYTMPLLYEQLTGRVPVQHLARDWWAAWSDKTSASLSVYRILKRPVDILVSLVALGCLLALTPFVALAIRLDSRGPIFYQQVRSGCNGHPFQVAKFRTMRTDAEADGQARWSAQDDPRITRVGRWLRRTRIDELPQFLNILRGEMSLIGPRPERPEFVEQLSETLPFYRARHMVRPGLTGWAQVCYRYGNSVDDSLVKLEYDLFYIKHEGPYLDLLILLKTVGVVARLEGF